MPSSSFCRCALDISSLSPVSSVLFFIWWFCRFEAIFGIALRHGVLSYCIFGF
ncbi:hypothetical protein BDV11DRAFT_179806 [Aspergillus similis]